MALGNGVASSGNYEEEREESSMTDYAINGSKVAATTNEQTNLNTTNKEVLTMVNTETKASEIAMQEQNVRLAYLESRQADLEHAFKPSATGAVTAQIADMAKSIHKLAKQRLAVLKGEVSYGYHSDDIVCSSVDDEGMYKDYTSGLVGVMYFGSSESAAIPRKGYSKYDLERMEKQLSASATESLYKGPIVDDEEQFVPEEWGCEAITEDLAEWLNITDTLERIEDEDDRKQDLAIEEFLSTSHVDKIITLTGGYISDEDSIL